MGKGWGAVMACAALCATLWAVPAEAAFPGKNGKIAFARDGDIWTVNPDGTGRIRITTNPARDFYPRWSPDGKQIAFGSLRDEPNPGTCTNTCRYEVYVMDADGSNEHRLTTSPTNSHSIGASWSPDGTRLAFARANHIWVINVDGSGEHRITPGQTNPNCLTHFFGPTVWSPSGADILVERTSYCGDSDSTYPCFIDPQTGSLTGCLIVSAGGLEVPRDWSPDSSRLVVGAMSGETFQGLYTIGRNGNQYNPLTNATFEYDDGWHGAAWSPDGTKIAFTRATWYENDPLIHIFDATDGDNMTQLSAGDAFESNPDWQAIPINAYPRPAGAYPIRASLVPAYEPCSSPNRTHGPPLGFGSCNPPTQEPGQLTVGTPDANGQGAKSLGYLRITTLTGNPATLDDEADVKLRANITDVRLRSDLADYTGDLEARLRIQITDKNNTPHPGGPGAATVQELTLSHQIPCAGTAGTTIGSTCQLATTVEALLPGAVVEKRRAIWELGAIRVHDGAGNLFMTQGLFVP